MSEQAIAEVVETPVQAPNDEEQFDEFGRTEAERTITLEPATAEAINVEVEVGEHKTYSDALEYVVKRGLAELKRTRDAAQKTRDAKAKSETLSTWKKIF